MSVRAELDRQCFAVVAVDLGFGLVSGCYSQNVACWALLMVLLAVSVAGLAGVEAVSAELG